MNPADLFLSLYSVTYDIMRTQETDSQIIFSQIFQRRKNWCHSITNILINGCTFYQSLPLQISFELPFCLKPCQHHTKTTSTQSLQHWLLYHGIFFDFRQEIHFLRNKLHHLALMTMEEQIHIIAAIVHRQQHPYQRSLCPTQFKIMHGYEYTFLHPFGISFSRGSNR